MTAITSVGAHPRGRPRGTKDRARSSLEFFVFAIYQNGIGKTEMESENVKIRSWTVKPSNKIAM